jgi:transcriptional regulator with XRE-family HTH domain
VVGSDLRSVFARNVRSSAEARGVSLNSLADFAGVSRAQMYNVLAGNSSPSLDWISKVAIVLECDAWELLVPEEHRRA